MEFAVENAQTLKKRSERSGRMLADKGADGEAKDPAAGPKPALSADAASAGVADAAQGSERAQRKRKRGERNEVRE